RSPRPDPLHRRRGTHRPLRDARHGVRPRARRTPGAHERRHARRVQSDGGLLRPLKGLPASRLHKWRSHPMMSVMSVRAGALAERLERGANALGNLAASLSDAEWNTRLPGDGRTIGVVVHHVASVYPLEIQLALKVADRHRITGVTMEDVHVMNAKHAAEFGSVTREAAVD